jgi:hypothetical protein
MIFALMTGVIFLSAVGGCASSERRVSQVDVIPANERVSANLDARLKQIESLHAAGYMNDPEFEQARKAAVTHVLDNVVVRPSRVQEELSRLEQMKKDRRITDDQFEEIRRTLIASVM